MAKVLVAVPTFDGGIRPLVFEGAANLDWGENDVQYRSVSGYDCEKARTAIAEEAVGRGFDYVMMIDADVVVPVDALTNLIEWEEPVMLGYYARQNRFDGETCLFKPPSYKQPFSAGELRALRDAGDPKVPVRGGGLGCALIRADVFGRLGKPWFRYVVRRDGTQLSEDLFFCSKARDAGLGVFADARVACGHYFRHIERLE